MALCYKDWATRLAFALCCAISTPANVAPVAVQNATGLSFGAVVTGSSPGTVTISSTGLRSCTGITCVPQSSASPARYTLSGDPFTTYVISLPLSASLSDGLGNFLTIDGFQDDVEGFGTLDASGSGAFSVGATLHLNAAQATGNYSGSFDVIVEYQ